MRDGIIPWMSLKIHEDDDKQNVISISKVIYMDVL